MTLTYRIECGHIFSVGLWSGLANLGRILRIDKNLLSGKSASETEAIIKPLMIKHYNNANSNANYKKNELTSYVFYDLSGNATSFSLEELGLAVARKDAEKDKHN
jgi:hypothetical protein